MIRARLGHAGAMTVLAALAFTSLSLGGAQRVFAQDGGAQDGGFGVLATDDAPEVTAGDAVVDRTEVPAGQVVRVTIPLSIVDHWHIYSVDEEMGQPTGIEVAEWPEGLSGGTVEILPEAKEFVIPGLEDSPQMVHEGDVTVSMDVTVAADAKPGPRTLSGLVNWMACDDSSCLPPDSAEWSVTFDVTAAVAGAVASPEPPAESSDGLSWGLIIEALTLGFLTVLTPCVFPMLPITVSFFAKQKGPALPRSVVYGFGWVFTIVVIGLILKSFLVEMAVSSLFNALVGLFFLVLSLSLFGLFDLRLPSALSDWSTKKSSVGGLVGAFFMAVTLAITSFSCSVPFLAVMFRRFESGEHLLAVVALTVYASALAAPFVLCSVFPALLGVLPRAGSWMNAIKVTMGFVEFGFAFKFLRTVDINFGWGLLPRDLVLAIWIACSLAAALYLFGHLVLPHDTKPESVGVIRMCFGMMFLSFAVFLVPPVFGKPLPSMVEGFIQGTPEERGPLFRPRGAGGASEDSGHIAWVKNDWDGSIARGAEKKRPVLFDFTGVG